MHADHRFMQQALSLASRQLGRTWPNPAVGCVVANGSRVVGIGATAHGGRPHAETQALAMAGDSAHGATAYVTLEPCAHVGETASCADALIAAGVARVVCAMRDPDARTNGHGLQKLRDAGIEVLELQSKEAVRQHAGFVCRIQHGRPMVALKLATTLDGRMSAPNGQSQWITNEAARMRGHLLRASHDAMLTGIGTVLADNPRLTCRLSGLENKPMVRVVLDSHLRLPENAALLEDIKNHPLWVICSEHAAQSAKAQTLRKQGVEILPCAIDAHGRLELSAALLLLGARGLTRVLAECGPALATSLLAERLADQLHWFIAPSLAGDVARSAIDALPEQTLDELLRFEPRQSMVLGDNRYHFYLLARH